MWYQKLFSTNRCAELVLIAELLATLIIQAPALAVWLAERWPPRLLGLVRQAVEVPASEEITSMTASISFVCLNTFLTLFF